MQSLTRTSITTGYNYTSSQVDAVLHSPIRKVRFRYDLLDSSNVYKKTLTNVLSCKVENNSENVIARTAKFTILDNGEITDFLNDRIKVRFQLWIPDLVVSGSMIEGDWVEWSLGIFLLNSPSKKVDPMGNVIRNIDAYDQTQILVSDLISSRYTITAGTTYISAITTILTSAGFTSKITSSSAILPSTLDWPIGTPKINITNTLLTSINYKKLRFDTDGYAICIPYILPPRKAVGYIYSNDSQSVIFPEVEQTIDLFNIPNEFTLVVSESDQDILISTYTNSNSQSPTSTTNRGRTISYFATADAADQATLDDLTEKVAFQFSQIYEDVKLPTAMMPFHDDDEVITLNFTNLNIYYNFNEISWSMELKAGAKMEHRLRRIVAI